MAIIQLLRSKIPELVGDLMGGVVEVFEQVERWEKRLASVIGKFHRNGFRARDNSRWLKLQGRVDKWGAK